jgi:hypothetical protein
MIDRPWLLQLGPLIIPTDAREELNALTVRRTSDEYVDAIWKKRKAEGPKVRRPRSLSWPKTWRTVGGEFRLIPEEKPSMVTTLKRKATS